MDREELLSYKAGLERAIERYENDIASQIRVNDKLFVLHIGFLILLVIFGIIINLNPNLASLIGTLGLGGLGVGTNWERLKETFKSFPKERSALKLHVSHLKNKLDIADLDEDRLKSVENAIKTLYERLGVVLD